MIEGLRGCGTALVTPFRRDGSVDFECFRKLVRRQQMAEVDFLVPCGATGEELSLRGSEYSELVRITKEESEGLMPVVASICDSSTHVACGKAIAALESGADALLVASPSYLKPTQEGIYCHFREIADATSLPIIIYDVPGRTASHMLPQTILRLAELPKIVGLKDASANLIDTATVAFGAPSSFTIFSGLDSLTLPMMAFGAVGVISVAANLVPHQIKAAVHFQLEGQPDAAVNIYRELWFLLTELAFETSPLPIKYCMAELGLVEEMFRLPLVPLSDAKRRRLAPFLGNLRTSLPMPGSFASSGV